jgi:phenylacetyl-CoA:acceptor oxidoreductase 26-kDa subunit
VERIAPWLQTQWDRRAAGNFIGGGTGAGLAICAAARALAAGAHPALAYAVAGLSIAAGLSLVWLEIGRPWRFLHVFLHPQASWMTREALVAPALLLALAVAAWRGGAAPALAALPLAAVFLYCQARMLRAARGIPAWREPRIVPLIVATGIAEGAGAFLALAVATGAAAGAPILAAALVALAARWIAWTAYCRRLEGPAAPAAARRALQAIDRPLLLAGTLAPAALILGALAFAALAAPLSAVAGLFALGAGWAVKLAIVTRAAFNQGFALPHLPRLDAARGDTSTRPGWS